MSGGGKVPGSLRLTPELVARVAAAAGPLVTGPMPSGRRPAVDADYDASVRDILATAPQGGDLWVFAYGSLIWNPAFEPAEARHGLVSGWHRSFCLGWDVWFRGSVGRPGLMLALDRGGRCRGVAYRLAAETVEQSLHVLVRREIRFVPQSYAVRWIDVATREGPVRAIAFAMNRRAAAYVGRLSPEQVADALAIAVGPWGSMAEYLHSTVLHLEERGIRDSRLWRLQEMVAERIERAGADESAAFDG